MVNETNIPEDYKQTEVGIIPEDWEVKKLGQIGTVIRGASPRPKGDPRYYGGNIPRLMVEDVTRDGKYVTPKVDFLTEEGAKKSRPCKAGTLTIVCSGTVGIPSLLAVDACIHDGFLALIDIEKSVSKDYLFHQLLTLKEKFESSATHGGVFTNLTTTILKEFEISLPPLPEQKAIATALGEVDALITALDQLISKKRHIKQGAMQELLTGKKRLPGFSGEWEMKQLGEITIKVGSGITPTGGEKVYKNEGRPFLRSQNVGWGKLLMEDIAFIDNETHDSFKATEVRQGDVFLNITGASIGRSAVADKRVENGNVNQHVCIIRPVADELDPYFLNYFLLSTKGQKQIDSFQAGGNRQGLNFGQIKSFSIPFSSLPEQQAIAQILSDMDAEIVALEQKRDKYQAIKQGMMQDLLTGRIRLLS